MKPNVGTSKAWLRADLARHRSALLLHLLGLTEEAITTEEVVEGLTAQHLLVILAEEDECCADALERVVAGEDVKAPATGPSDDPGHRDLVESLDATLSHLLKARAALLSALARMDEPDIARSRSDGRSIADWACECADRDVRAADALAEWRPRVHVGQSIGPKPVLIAALRAARKELLTTLALIPTDDRETYVVGGGEPLQDILARTARWEEDRLRELTQISGESREGAENEPSAQARETEPWASTWARLHSSHQRLLRALEHADADSLSRQTGGGANRQQTVYHSLISITAHDHHQAARLRQSVETRNPGSRAAL